VTLLTISGFLSKYFLDYLTLFRFFVILDFDPFGKCGMPLLVSPTLTCTATSIRVGKFWCAEGAQTFTSGMAMVLESKQAMNMAKSSLTLLHPATLC